MRNKLSIFLIVTVFFAAKIFADTTSVATDSSMKAFVPPNNGPLGIDNVTGVALYGVAILFAVLVIALWRMNIIKRR